MSAARRAANPDATAVEIFAYEIRRGGRPLVVLRGLQGAEGAVVEAEVYPATDPPALEAIRRPYAFSNATQATRFADEALLALEYLGCTVV